MRPMICPAHKKYPVRAHDHSLRDSIFSAALGPRAKAAFSVRARYLALSSINSFCHGGNQENIAIWRPSKLSLIPFLTAAAFENLVGPSFLHRVLTFPATLARPCRRRGRCRRIAGTHASPPPRQGEAWPTCRRRPGSRPAAAHRAGGKEHRDQMMKQPDAAASASSTSRLMRASTSATSLRNAAATASASVTRSSLTGVEGLRCADLVDDDAVGTEVGW